MATQTLDSTTPRINFNWILNPKRDILFYIGSALAGWLYVGIIFWAMISFDLADNPINHTLFKLLGVPITLGTLVILSWGIILDAPHLFATLARTFFDPDEWQVRRKEMNRSWLFFLLGPGLILTPYLLGQFVDLSPFLLGVGALGFLVFFRLWAYYHVVRQHWGFYRLYKRKANDYSNLIDTADYWFFQLTLYLPLLMFLTSSWYLDVPSSAFPPLGLQAPIVGNISISTIVYPLTLIIYSITIVGYLAIQIYLYLNHVPLNGSKLVYMLLIVPLHFIAFSHPIMVLFVVPIVTVGHNIQYHQIVYEYGKKKYHRDLAPEVVSKFSRVRFIFKNFAIYAVLGLIFTLLLYRGPWINWVGPEVGESLNNVVLNSVGMMAGINDVESLNLGEQLFGAFLLGWAMQHYYLDSKIWRVSKDKMVSKNLGV